MKELSEERVLQLGKKHLGFDPGCIEIAMLQEAYLLGQQEAGVNEQRFRAACAALMGYNSNPNTVEAGPEFKAQWSRLDADALIAELKKPKKGAH